NFDFQSLVVLIFVFLLYYYIFSFFFQAEDGIRDRNVTGVQTCALPISNSPRAIPAEELAEIALDAGWDEDQIFTTGSVVDAISWAVQGVRDVDAQVQDAGRTLTAGTGGAGVLVTGSI